MNLSSFPVQVTPLVAIRVTVHDVQVNLGDSAILRCRYSRVTNTSLLVVKWEHGSSGVWMYNGLDPNGMHIGQGKGREKFERADSDLKVEHAIRLREAKLEDSGTYVCNVEYYEGGYQEAKKELNVYVKGKS